VEDPSTPTNRMLEGSVDLDLTVTDLSVDLDLTVTDLSVDLDRMSELVDHDPSACPRSRATTGSPKGGPLDLCRSQGGTTGGASARSSARTPSRTPTTRAAALPRGLSAPG